MNKACGDERPLRLAIYGFVEKQAGSTAGANFVIVERLLRRGHLVDFFAIEDFVGIKELRDASNLSYRGTRRPIVEAIWWVINWIPMRGLRTVVQVLFSNVSSALYHRTIGAEIRRSHQPRPYDALLVLGLLSPFRVAGLHTVSWAQGTPLGERHALQNQKATLIARCGWLYYSGLMVYYAWREFQYRRCFPNSNVVIFGSRWTLSKAVEMGFPAEKGVALPYPINLELYRPASRMGDSDGTICLLHLGRIVPRKRLDLLLEAFRLLRQDEPNVCLRIIGAFAYAQAYKKLLADPRLMEGVEYLPAIPRAEALEVLRSSDILVQPSENEDFGSAVAEAQACGLPVVLGPTNGTGDYLDCQDFVFDAYEPVAVAQAMARAVRACRTQRGELAASARAAALRHYDADRIVSDLERLLRPMPAELPTPVDRAVSREGSRVV